MAGSSSRKGRNGACYSRVGPFGFRASVIHEPEALRTIGSSGGGVRYRNVGRVFSSEGFGCQELMRMEIGFVSSFNCQVFTPLASRDSTLR